MIQQLQSILLEHLCFQNKVEHINAGKKILINLDSLLNLFQLSEKV